MRAAAWLVALGLCACRAAPQPSGAAFLPVTPTRPAAGVEAVFAVCWPPDAPADARVTLLRVGDDYRFDVTGGASNGTGRCAREIATSWPWEGDAPAELALSPPPQPIDGWGVLAWVKLLSSSRYGPERGLVDAAPLVRACLEHGVGPPLRFSVADGALRPAAQGAERERCVAAVLGSTVWPTTRALDFAFDSTGGAPAAGGDVRHYFAPSTSAGPALAPEGVREALGVASSAVRACWDAALVRRPDLGGGRAFRFQVGADGRVTQAWVVEGLDAGPSVSDFLLDACLASALRSARFTGGPGEGLYGWRFTVRGG